MDNLREDFKEALNEIGTERVKSLLNAMKINKVGYIGSKDLKEDLEVIKLVSEVVSYTGSNRIKSDSINERLDDLEETIKTSIGYDNNFKKIINEKLADMDEKLNLKGVQLGKDLDPILSSLWKEINAIKKKIVKMEKEFKIKSDFVDDLKSKINEEVPSILKEVCKEIEKKFSSLWKEVYGVKDRILDLEKRKK